MRVFVTGGTGLIGRRIVQRLVKRGDEPVILSRKADEARRNKAMRAVQFVQGDPAVVGPWMDAVEGCDAVINLAGENLFAKRWNAPFKNTIRDSRVLGTEGVVRAIAETSSKPKVLVQASAIGIYGPQGDEELTEESPSGTDFMAKVCREWEDSAKPVQALGVRLATIRTGVVLAKGEGALGVMTPIFKMGGAAPIGGSSSLLRPGSGTQWMSWIHLDDIVGLFLHALDEASAVGPINGTSPNPVRNIDFGRALAKVLFRPMLPIGPPDLMLNLLLGEVADVVAKGQRVLPAKAEALGYHFAFPNLPEALKDLFKKVVPEPAAPKADHGHGHGHDKAHAHH